MVPSEMLLGGAVTAISWSCNHSCRGVRVFIPIGIPINSPNCTPKYPPKHASWKHLKTKNYPIYIYIYLYIYVIIYIYIHIHTCIHRFAMIFVYSSGVPITNWNPGRLYRHRCRATPPVCSSKLRWESSDRSHPKADGLYSQHEGFHKWGYPKKCVHNWFIMVW